MPLGSTIGGSTVHKKSLCQSVHVMLQSDYFRLLLIQLALDNSFLSTTHGDIIYIEAIQLHVTGLFHAMCLYLFTLSCKPQCQLGISGADLGFCKGGC